MEIDIVCNTELYVHLILGIANTQYHTQAFSIMTVDMMP